MPLPSDPVAWAIKQFRTERTALYATYEAYAAGRQPNAVSPASATGPLGNLLVAMTYNRCAAVIDAIADRLSVTGFRDADGKGDAGAAMDLWRANRMDKREGEVNQEALTEGDGYAIIWPDVQTALPTIWPQDAACMRVRYDDEQPGLILVAAKLWRQDDDYLRLNLYLPDRLEKYISRSKYKSGLPNSAAAFEQYQPDGDLTWPLRYDWYADNVPSLPVFHFANNARTGRYGTSELRDIVRIQDALNKSVTDLIKGSELGGHPQKWATGVDIDPKDAVVVGADRILGSAKADGRFGSFDATNLEQLIAVVNQFDLMVARTARIPVHYLALSGDFPSGEALALDTLVPTPHGMTTMGALHVGDAVFDERGHPQIVTDAFPVLFDRPCYRVVFDDATEFIADAGHKWLTEKIGSGGEGRMSGEVRTTEEIAQTIKSGGGRFAAHAVQVAQALQLPDADLPIDPYAFGVWLGDGDSHDAVITMHENDHEIVDHLAAVGVASIERGSHGRPHIRRVRLDPLFESGKCRRGHARVYGQKCPECQRLNDRHKNHGDPVPEPQGTFRQRLLALGVVRNKHIPEVYFQASEHQRLALLQGLMDTDGTCQDGGHVSIAFANETLARDTVRLVCSLGERARVTPKSTVRDDRTFLEYRIHWTPRAYVFRLQRKRDRQVLKERPRTRRRYIVAVNPVPSVPVRCIRVTGDSHLFLVGEQCVPTHNSLKTAEAPFVRKIIDRQIAYGNVWEDALTLALRMQKIELTFQLECVYEPAEPRSDREAAELAYLWKQAGMPLPAILRDLGRTDDEIAQIMADSDAMLERARAAFDAGEEDLTTQDQQQAA